MPRSTLSDWIDHLRTVSRPVLAARNSGPLNLNTGPLDEPLSLALDLVDISTVKVIQAPDPLPQTAGPEVGLWWALVDSEIDVEPLIQAPTKGSLLPQDRYAAIEVWTDAELSALHALWNLAHIRQCEQWRKRVETVRDWHLENIQPDNATLRPWALHVFLLGDSAECTAYAETLLHNALAMTGKPTLLGAALLRDAARQIELSLQDS